MGKGGGASGDRAGHARPSLASTPARATALAWGRLQLAEATFIAFRMLGGRQGGGGLVGHGSSLPSSRRALRLLEARRGCRWHPASHGTGRQQARTPVEPYLSSVLISS